MLPEVRSKGQMLQREEMDPCGAPHVRGATKEKLASVQLLPVKYYLNHLGETHPDVRARGGSDGPLCQRRLFGPTAPVTRICG